MLQTEFSPDNTMRKILLVDADNLLHRAFHAVPPMKSPSGVPNNALRGALSSILALQKQLGPFDQTLCAFDSGTPKFRKFAVPSYKTGRKEKPPELSQQLELARTTLMPAMGWNAVSQPATEADDLIYSLCLRCLEDDTKIVIASGDKDIAQCLCLGESLLLARPPKKAGEGWDTFSPKTAHLILGVVPDQIPCLLALCGDTSDNLPGVPGVGPVTAKKWLDQFGDAESILKNKDSIEPTRFREKITSETIEANLLVTQSYDTGVAFPEKITLAESPEELLKSLGLFALLSRI